MYSQKWYQYYNNRTCDPKDVLVNNECCYTGNIIIARKSCSYFMYSKFVSVHAFCLQLSQTVNTQRMYYVVLRSPSRYPYIDIDCKLKDSLTSEQTTMYLQSVLKTICTFSCLHGYKYGLKNNSNWLLWNGSRCDKFSCHLVDPNNVVHYLDIKRFSCAFNSFLHSANVLPPQCKADTCVYKAGCQLWRLPFNHNGNVQSELRLYKSAINPYEQLAYNIMDGLTTCVPSVGVSVPILPVAAATMSVPSNCMRYLVFHAEEECCTASQSLQEEIQQKMENLLQIKLVSGLQRQMVLKRHHCPIANRIHNSNTARLVIRKIKSRSQSLFAVYNCFDEDCGHGRHYLYITLSVHYFRPWLLSYFPTVCDSKLKQMDKFVELLFKKEIIIDTQQSQKHQIINNKSIQTENKVHWFRFSFLSRIVHQTCQHSGINVHYNHLYDCRSNPSSIFMHCKRCECRIHYHHDHLVHRSIKK